MLPRMQWHCDHWLYCTSVRFVLKWFLRGKSCPDRCPDWNYCWNMQLFVINLQVCLSLALESSGWDCALLAVWLITFRLFYVLIWQWWWWWWWWWYWWVMILSTWHRVSSHEVHIMPLFSALETAVINIIFIADLVSVSLPCTQWHL